MSFLGLPVRNDMLEGAKNRITHIEIADDDNVWFSGQLEVSWSVSGGVMTQVGSVTFSFPEAQSRKFSGASLYDGSPEAVGYIPFDEPLVVGEQAGEATVSSLKVELPE